MIQRIKILFVYSITFVVPLNQISFSLLMPADGGCLLIVEERENLFWALATKQIKIHIHIKKYKRINKLTLV